MSDVMSMNDSNSELLKKSTLPFSKQGSNRNASLMHDDSQKRTSPGAINATVLDIDSNGFIQETRVSAAGMDELNDANRMNLPLAR
jgi:hypothetical protein